MDESTDSLGEAIDFLALYDSTGYLWTKLNECDRDKIAFTYNYEPVD